MRAALLLFTLAISLNASSQLRSNEKERAVDSIMQAHLVHSGKKPVHSFLLYARNSETGFEIHKGFGLVGRDDTPVDPGYQYNCASITKTFVAVLVLQLEEEGKLKLTDKAYGYLASLPFARADKVHILDGRNYSKEITIEQLLQHTSGIADIFTDAATKFNISVLLHKRRQFTTERIMGRYFRYKLNKKPRNAPGLGYHYSDMNYMLLGLIVEQLRGKSLPECIRERILVPSNMSHTYFEYYEPAVTEGKRVDAFLGKINMTKKINTSYEWGGGGLVSTTRDLAVFIQCLFDGKFFSKDATLPRMIDLEKVKSLGANYGLGLFSVDVNGRKFYGHGGFYGSLLLYEPAHKITFSGNISQATPPYDTERLVMSLLGIIISEN